MADAFREYKSHPTADSLIRLLRAHQDRIYGLCYHVLGRAHDAEDAAQEVLLRVVDHARKFDDPDSFRRWVHRVSLNAALESARKSSRRRAHESRAVMHEPSPPLDAETRAALFEGLSKLDDASRSLLLDRYFEGETLESIAERDGVTSQAVSKRMDRAREDLRRLLPAGLVMIDLGRLFPSTPPSPDLVTGPVLVKVAAGAATKSAAVQIAVAAVLIVFVGGTIAVMSRRDPKDSTVAINRPTRLGEYVQTPEKLALAASSISSELPVRRKWSPLEVRLNRFKSWWQGMQEESKAAHLDGERYAAFRPKWEEELWENVSGLRALILGDPEGFLRFLRDPENEPVLGDLVRMGLLTQTDRPHVWHMAPFKDFPTELTHGLFQLLQSGTIAQRSASLRLLGELPDTPDHYKDVYLSLLDDPSPELKRQAIGLVTWQLPMTQGLFSKLAELGNHSENLYIRLAVVSSMSSVQTPQAEAFVLGRLAAADHDNELFQITFSLESRYRGARQAGKPILEENLMKSLVEAIGRNHHNYLHRLLPVAAFLPAARLKPLLQQAMAKTEYDWYRDRLAKAVERIGQGPYTPEDVVKILEPR